MIEEKHWWIDRCFLYVGRMVLDKGVDIILRAWIDLQVKYGDECPQLWLVGGTPAEIDELRRATGLMEEIQRYEHAKQIQWWGYLDAAGISTLLLHTLVMIMHSRYEPGGRVVLEAMSEGVPVIATPHGFAKDFIIDWENGFLVKYGDQETLVRRMEHFIHQPLLRNSLGATAREIAINSMNAWRFLDKHCQIYDLALRKNGNYLNSAQPHDHDKIRYPYFYHRRFVPTYPYGREPPLKVRIKEFVESSIGHSVTEIHLDQRNEGSSFRWFVLTGSKQWVVKWPYTRLATRPLWDPDRRDPLIRPIQHRFASELFSSNLVGFAPVTAAEKSDYLLLRPFFNPLRKSVELEQIQKAISAFRKTFNQPIPKGLRFLKGIDKDWSSASIEEIQLTLKNVRHSLAQCSEQWNINRHVSLRLAWRQMELNLLSGKIGISRKWMDETKLIRDRVISLAQLEKKEPIVICHGSGDMDHCVVTEDGSLRLIDGENIHPGWPGEDFAAIIGCVIDDINLKQDEFQIWIQALDVIAENDIDPSMIISWAAFLTLEDICRNTVLINPTKVQHYKQRWDILGQLALERNV